MDRPIPGIADTIRMARHFVRHDPGRVLRTLSCLLVAGLLEGIGFVSLLPVIGIATGESANSALNQAVLDAFGYVGLEPTLAVLLLVVSAGMVGKAMLTLLAQRSVGFATADFATEMRLEIIRRLLEARWTHFVSLPLGRVSNALSNETTIAAGAFSALTNLMAMVVQVAILSAIALATSWQVTLVGLLSGAAAIVVLKSLIAIGRRAGGRQAKLMNVLMARFSDGLSLIKPLKAMGQEARLLPLLEDDARAINRAQRQLTLASRALSVVQEPIVAVLLAVGIYVGLTYSAQGFADLLFMALLFHRIVGGVTGLQVHYQKMVSQEGAYWQMREITDGAAAARDDTAHGGQQPQLNKGIRLCEVSFRYADLAVLDRLSLDIPAARITAVIGPSGAGKTTLVDLIVGLIQPLSGKVLVDDVPLEAIDSVAWRQGIGYLPQESVLLHDSVRANVTLGDDRYSDERVRQALAIAGALSFVDELPGGINTSAGERGSRFSGGQRQRIALARALIRRPRLLILDEPTAALDPASERLLCDTLKGLAGQMTILVISHQPAVTEIADAVYVMDGGTLSRRVSARPEPAAAMPNVRLAQ